MFNVSIEENYLHSSNISYEEARSEARRSPNSTTYDRTKHERRGRRMESRGVRTARGNKGLKARGESIKRQDIRNRAAKKTRKRKKLV